jgi:hypothetical protein
MSNTSGFLEARRALLEKYLRGNLPQAKKAAEVIPRRASGSHLPLSFGQQQIWLLARLALDSPVYNECVTIHLPGPLDVAALEQSFNEISKRHEAWRTSFPLVDGQPVQMIHPHTTLTLPVVDLRFLVISASLHIRSFMRSRPPRAMSCRDICRNNCQAIWFPLLLCYWQHCQ